MMSRQRQAFTLIEILIILLVVGTGLFSVVALAAHGSRIASYVQGETIAMATAVTIAYDPQPRLDPTVASDWSYTPYDLDGSGALTSIATGYVNGLHVERTETSLDRDVIARDATARVQARSAQVLVIVSDANNGGELASFMTRIVRQREGPP